MATRPHGDGATRVLVWVEQPSISELVKLTLNHGVFVTREASTIVGATTIFDEWAPQMAVIDVDGGGTEFLQQISRAEGDNRPSIPVLGLTRRGDLKTTLAAFDQGVEDIMRVPFSPEEMLARVLVITRRSYGRSTPLEPLLRLGDLEIDIVNRQVRIGSSLLHLTGLEQSLLYLLAANAGKLLTREEILEAIWGTDFIAGSNVVDRHIRNLRVKLQNGWHQPRFIKTVPGEGYRFEPMLPATASGSLIQPVA